MTKKNWFAQQFEQFEDDPEFSAGLLRLKLFEDILRIMEEQGVTRSELATRLSCSKAYITKLFNDSTNVTLHTLVRISLALGCDVEVALVPRSADKHADFEKQNSDNLPTVNVHKVIKRKMKAAAKSLKSELK